MSCVLAMAGRFRLTALKSVTQWPGFSWACQRGSGTWSYPPNLWRCHHELAEVRKKAAEGLTRQEIEAAKRKVLGLLSKRPEESRDLPLPHPITVVVSAPPGSGKRK